LASIGHFQHCFRLQTHSRTASIQVQNITEEAAAFNASVLKENNNNNFQEVIDAHPRSVLCPGSEFRALSILEQLMFRHPHWTLISLMFSAGAQTTFSGSFTHQQRHDENDAKVAFGCHKLASIHLDEVEKVIQTEVMFGYTLPLPEKAVKTLAEIMIVTVGMAQQSTILELGKRIPKL
jgi:hypothetical protein